MTVRLLIIDDEPSLLELLKRYLERMGYQVDTAAESASALAGFAADPLRYDLVITDLHLPGAGGEELLAQMRKLNPGLRALIASGLPYQPSQPLTGFVQKPFLPKTLAEQIERALR